MEIRKILPSDSAELGAVYAKVFSAPPWNGKWTADTATTSLACIMQAPGFYGNVVLAEGKIIGAVLGRIRVFGQSRSYNMDEFFVTEHWRRQGVATALYRYSIEELKSNEVSGIFFTTLRNSPAYEFYRKAGAWDLTDSACFYHLIK